MNLNNFKLRARLFSRTLRHSLRSQGTALALVAVLATQVLAGCGPSSAGQAQGPRDECGLIEPTDADVAFALSFGSTAYMSEDWVKSYTVEPYKISLTRSNEALRAISYLEFLIFNCGYGQTDLDSYFSDTSFNIIFSDYESHTQVNFCEEKSLALYEYDLVDEGTEFSAHYWAKQATDTRLLVVMLVFPKARPDDLARYSQQIFPSLTSCP